MEHVSPSKAVLIETNDITDQKDNAQGERWVKVRYFKEVTNTSPMNDAAC